MHYRLATTNDIQAMCELGRLMHGESSFAPLDFDAAVLAKTLERLHADGQFLAVAEAESGEVVGALVGMAVPSFFGRDLVANDLGLFVAPAHRHGLVAARLIRAFVAWAEARGAKQVRPGVSTGHPGAERLLEALGFARVGAAFCKTF